MFEKVNPSHPDKLADRIAGALVDMAYKLDDKPRVAVEVLLGHGKCSIINETSVKLRAFDVEKAVKRIAQDQSIKVEYREFRQDIYLSNNQNHNYKCGDNGIFRGSVVTEEQHELSQIAHKIYNNIPFDGKYILSIKDSSLIVCQSNADTEAIRKAIDINGWHNLIINPLGSWTGGINVDSGATNRKLGSDMGDAVTGGGLHGKDLSKADVSVNIYAHLKAQKMNAPVELYCAIGDENIDGHPYADIVKIAQDYIKSRGGFEKFAEWGLI